MKRIFWVTCWMISFAIVASAQTTFYYPHIANGVLGATIWKTTIFLTNPSPSGVASGTISFNQDNGLPFPVSFVDETGLVTSGNIVFSIAGGQSKKYVSTGTGTYSPGFATVTASAGTVSGTSIFSEFTSGGQLIGEAGVPQAAAVTKQAIFVDTVGGYNIGVAYANPGGSAAHVQLSLLDSTAAIVAATTQLIAALNHGAAFSSQLFNTNVQLAGTMQIVSDAPLATIALRFDPNFQLFTTLPSVTLSSLISPGMEWLHERPLFAPLTSIARLLGAFQLRI